MWKPIRPRFEIARGYRDTNPFDGPKLKLWRERARNQTDGRVMHANGCSLCQTRSYASSPKASKCFLRISATEVPDDFPPTARAHPAQQSRRTGFEQGRQVPGELRKILNAIEGAEVRERTVEGFTAWQPGDVFGSHQARLHQAGFFAFSDPASRNFD